MSRAPTSVLDLWEAGLPRTPAARAVLLLEAAGHVGVERWPVGRGHAALLDAWCGGRLDALAGCPGCGAVLELAVGAAGWSSGTTGPVTVHDGPYAVTANPPTLGDLSALSATDGVASLRRQLLTRCVDAATADGSPVAAAELPDDVVDRVEAALDEADPAADLRLALTCPECATTWSESLDPPSFAWHAVEGAARRLAGEVHTLALAYGWSETDVLALTPFRRQLYLSAVPS